MMALVASQGIRLLPDGTFFPQLAIFLFVVIVLTGCVLRPIVRIVQRREAETLGKQREAAERNTLAEAVEGEIRETISTAKREQLNLEEKLALEVERETRSIIEKARASAQEKFEVERTRIAGIAAEETKRLEEEVPVLAKMLKQEILGSNGKA